MKEAKKIAKELVEKFEATTYLEIDGKKCALIVVNEIRKELELLAKDCPAVLHRANIWTFVKDELNNY